jgi:predicted RNase H-like nuclease (RuvC/YqgF family)
MSNHAENLHLGIGMLGNSLANAIVANNQRRREERLQAEAEANSVQSVRRLAAMLAAAQRENAALRGERAALQEEIDGLRFDLRRTQAALSRML